MSTPSWPTSAPAALKDTDSIARLGRAVAVTLIAATQRPTQKAMGQGAVRSQMDIAHLFSRPRARRRRPRPRAGHAQRRLARAHPQRSRQVPGLRTRARHAHAALAPTSSATRPSAETAARYAAAGPNWTMFAAGDRRGSAPARSAEPASASRPADAEARPSEAGDSRGRALARAVHGSEDGCEIGELMRAHRDEAADPVPAPEPAREGRPRVQVSRGTVAREHHRGAVTMSDRLTVRLVSRSRARVCT